MAESLYKDIALSKTGKMVPLFQNAHSMHSRYDPEKEAQRFVSNLNTDGNFFVVAGIGGAYLLEEIKKKFPESFILGAEHSQEDLDFLLNIPVFKKVKSMQNVFFFPVEQVDKMIKSYYLPALHDSLTIIESSAWLTENKNDIELFRLLVKKASDDIKSDFSVQAHFGSLWQHNILKNFQYAKSLEKKMPTEKTACIVASGPSLDKSISYIKQNRNELYIIATDTSYTTLTHHKIFCDAVVSIDAQHISYSHFMKNEYSKNTLFFFDISSSHSAIHHIAKKNQKMEDKNCPIYFITTGHPLASYILKCSEKSFPLVNSGSGTVTIAAIDLSIKLGFKKLCILGADFSYSKKPYAKGTYLDALYAKNATRTENLETQFLKLMYRSELHACKKGLTNEVLDSYKKTFDIWISENCENFTEEDFICKCIVKKQDENNQVLINKNLIQENILVDWKSIIEKFFLSDSVHSYSNASIHKPKMLEKILIFLPKIANIKKRNNFSKSISFSDTLKLAHDDFLRYTEII